MGLAVLAAIGSQFAGPFAMAQDAGWYIGANIGQTKAKIDDARIARGLLAGGLTMTSISDDGRDNGYKFLGGYQLNRNFAIEAGFFDLGKFSFVANTLPAGSLTGEIKLRGANLDLVGMLPLSESFSVFGRIGLNHAEARDAFRGTGRVAVVNPNPSKRDTNYKAGVGLQLAFNDRLAMRVEAERYRINDAVGNKGDIDLFSIGLVYRFGGKSQAYAPRAAAPAPEPARDVIAVAPTPIPAAPAVAPVPPPPPPRFEKYTLSATELFGFDSAELRLPQPKLDEIANALRINSQIGNVDITGYADRLGPDQYNQKLSERRAVAVRDYLTSKGINANRLRAEGKGEANPVVVCTNKRRPDLIKCLEPNRRVEIAQITIERRVQ